jgi:hypothetical protein
VNYLEALSNVLLDYRLFEDDSISIDIGGDVQEGREFLRTMALIILIV